MNQNISLIDVDGKMPNLALMKISSWHRTHGDRVKWYDPLMDHPDLIYASKIFNFTPDYDAWPAKLDCPVIKGGTGYDIKSRLPDEVDQMWPDYTLYPSCDYALGFLTRGCINNCPWCIVPEKEGNLRPDRAWTDIMRSDSRKIVFLDNNVLASDFGINQLDLLMQFNAHFPRESITIDFNQGLDARKINRELAKFLCALKWQRYIRLACDNQAMIDSVCRAIRLIRRIRKSQEIFVYLLITENIMDAVARVDVLRGFDNLTMFAQPFRDPHNPHLQPNHEQTMFARYVNVKGSKLCKRMNWSDYKRTGKVIDRDTPDMFNL